MRIDIKKKPKPNPETLTYGDTVEINGYYYIYCNANRLAHFIALDVGNRWDDGLDIIDAASMTVDEWSKRIGYKVNKIKLKVVLDDDGT